MFSSVSKLFCCQPSDPNEDKANKATIRNNHNNRLTPMSTINSSSSQNFLSLIQPNEGDITTISLKVLDKLSKYTIIKTSFANTHCLMLIDNEGERILTAFGSNVLGQLGIEIIPQDININYHKKLCIVQPDLLKNSKVIDMATSEKFSIVLIEGKDNAKRRLILFGSLSYFDKEKGPVKVSELQTEIDLYSIDKVYLTRSGSMLILQSITNGLYVKDNTSNINNKDYNNFIIINNKFRLLHQFNHRIVSVSIMNETIVVALSNNTIVAFGSNAYLSNSNNTISNTNGCNNNSILSHHLIKKVVSGLNHSLILCQDGAVFAFGDNKYNQCTKDNDNYLKDPHPVLFEEGNERPNIVDVACGDTFSLAICNSGSAYIWGTSDFFFAPEDTSNGPKKIDKLYLDNIKSITAYGNSALCLGQLS